MTTYKIVRFFERGGSRVIKRGLSLETARKHCDSPQTSSLTCTTAKAKRRTARVGHWFDGYAEDGR